MTASPGVDDARLLDDDRAPLACCGATTRDPITEVRDHEPGCPEFVRLIIDRTRRRLRGV